jgi:hypothetical protein
MKVWELEVTLSDTTKYAGRFDMETKIHMYINFKSGFYFILLYILGMLKIIFF